MGKFVPYQDRIDEHGVYHTTFKVGKRKSIDGEPHDDLPCSGIPRERFTGGKAQRAETDREYLDYLLGFDLGIRRVALATCKYVKASDASVRKAAAEPLETTELDALGKLKREGKLAEFFRKLEQA